MSDTRQLELGGMNGKPPMPGANGKASVRITAEKPISPPPPPKKK